jgi:hypothetical protein
MIDGKKHEGSRFGKWTIKKRHKKVGGRDLYHCICDCGTLKLVNISDLSSGRTTKCLRCRQGKSMPSDMVGKKFGKWSVIEYVDIGKPSRNYMCVCDCGTQKIVRGDLLRNGRSSRCKECRYGDLKKIRESMIGKRYGKRIVLSEESPGRLKCKCDCGDIAIVSSSHLSLGKKLSCRRCNVLIHGMEGTTTYNTWRCMLGGRGITVCERWSEFKNFHEDMGDRPTGMQIDRIDNNGNYCKENCRWVTPKENSNNRRKRPVLWNKKKRVRRKKSSPDKQTSLV